MIELKAELLKKKKEFEESKKEAKEKGGLRKIPINTKSSTSTSKTSNKDELIETKVSEDVLKKSKESLEAKARLYNRLEKGKLMESDLNAAQRENLMVDFTCKGWNPETEEFDFKSDSSEDSENEKSNEKQIMGIDEVLSSVSNSKHQDPNQWIEYEDEFGRVRVAKLGEILQIQAERQEVSRFREQQSTTHRQDTLHYDGDAEIRNKGVGFYQFAVNEAERQVQMNELKKLRSETLEKRMRSLLLKEQRRLRIENRLQKLKERKAAAAASSNE